MFLYKYIKSIVLDLLTMWGTGVATHDPPSTFKLAA